MSTNISDATEVRNKNPRRLSVGEMNFTQTPNIFFDDWMPIIGMACFGVLSCIIRKTTGWHKYEDHISRSQLAQMTGLAKSTLKICLDELVGYGLIVRKEVKKDNGSADANLYCLDFSKGEFQNKITYTENRWGGTPKIGETKETPTKETPPPSPPPRPSDSEDDFSSPSGEGEAKTIKAPRVPKRKKEKKTWRTPAHQEVAPDVWLTPDEQAKAVEQWGDDVSRRAWKEFAIWKQSKTEAAPNDVEKHTDHGRLVMWGYQSTFDRKHKITAAQALTFGRSSLKTAEEEINQIEETKKAKQKEDRERWAQIKAEREMAKKASNLELAARK